MSRYDAGRIEPKWQEAWDAAGLFRAERDAGAAEVLRAGDVPLSVGAHPHGARAQLHAWATSSPATRRRAASTCCTRWAGTPSACRPRTPRSSRACRRRAWTYQNIAAMRAQMKPLGLLDRLEPRVRHLRPGILRPAAGAVPRHARGRARHPQGGGGELGPGRHDRARQRAGDRRQGLALGRAGRAARADAVVLPHLRHGRGAARRARRAGGLAGEGAPDAAQLDRQEPRAAVRLRDPRRAGGLRERSRSTPPGPTRSGARASPPSRPSIRWRRRWRATRRSRPSSPSAGAIGTSEEEIETAEKKGFDTGIRVVHPFDPAWELPVYIANFILMDYGTGAIFGCPAHDQRDLDFARKYGLPVIDVFAAPGLGRAGRRRGLRAAEERAGRVPAPGRRRRG